MPALTSGALLSVSVQMETAALLMATASIRRGSGREEDMIRRKKRHGLIKQAMWDVSVNTKMYRMSVFLMVIMLRR